VSSFKNLRGPARTPERHGQRTQRAQSANPSTCETALVLGRYARSSAPRAALQPREPAARTASPGVIAEVIAIRLRTTPSPAFCLTDEAKRLVLAPRARPERQLAQGALRTPAPTRPRASGRLALATCNALCPTRTRKCRQEPGQTTHHTHTPTNHTRPLDQGSSWWEAGLSRNRFLRISEEADNMGAMRPSRRRFRLHSRSHKPQKMM
jgi:hypothetical protein